MSRASVQAGKAVIVVDVVDKATSSFRKMQSSLMSAARGFRDLGTNSAGAALLTGVPIAKGLGNYAKFTNSIQNIEAKLGNFGQTSTRVRQDSNALRQEIIQLGRDTAYTSTEIADAAGALAAGGFQNPRDIQASLKAIADLGRGTKMALEDAAKMSISIATTFKLFREGDSGNNSSAMTTLADQLVKAGRLSIAGADDIGASLVYVAQKAADLGVTVPEVLTLLNQLAQAGIKGSVAGTSLNTAFGNLTNNLSKLKEQFPGFDIIFKKDGSVDAIETFGKLGQLMRNMGKVQKTQFLQDVFNLRGERAASALEDIEGMRRGLQDIKNSADEASKSAQTMQAGFGGALERIGGAIDAVYNKIGTKFDKQLKGTAEIIALVIDQVDKLSTKYLALTAAIIVSPVIFASIAIGALSLSFVLARLSTVVGVLLKGFKGIKSIGSVMLGGAKSLVSPVAAMSNSRSVRAAAIKKTSEKIAKLQTALDIAYAKASAKKVGSVEAIAKVAASKKAMQLVAANTSLSKLQTKGSGIGSLLSRGKAGLSGAGSSIANRIRGVAVAMRETKEIKSQVRLERLLSLQEVKKNKLKLDAIKDTPLNEAKRLERVVQLNKASIAAKQKALHYTKLQKDAQHGLNELTFISSRTDTARERAIQQAYDELYKTRQQQKGVSAKQHPTTYHMLAEKEAKLAKFINAEQGKQARVAGRIFLAESKIATLKGKAAEATKLSNILGARAVRNAHQIKMAENLNFTNRLRRDAIVAKSTAQGVASTARITRAGQALKGASIGKALFGGMKLPALGASLGKAISGIAQLAFSFTRLTFSLTRFVFSWNFVGLALNALILFGDKIPAVNKAFKDIGAGFSAAFFQIGRIAEYGAPALSLFSLAIEAFSSGNTAIGVRSLAAAFRGIVDIIQNQLSAAWSAFSMKVSDLWLTLTKIGTAIFSVFSTLFMGLGEIVGNAFEGVSDRVSKLFSGKGESTFMSGLMTVALSLNNFISAFSESIIRLEDWGGKFLNTIQDIASGKATAQAVINAPKNIGNAIFDDPWRNFLVRIGKMTKEEKIAIETEIAGGAQKENPRIAAIEAERLKTEKELVELFSKNSDPLREKNRKDAVNANEKSDTASQIMKNRFDSLLSELTLTIEAQTEKVRTAAAKPPFVENMDQGGLEGTVQRFVTKLDALVGSLGETRNLYKIDKPDTISEIKKTNQKLDNINQTIKTSGLIGH